MMGKICMKCNHERSLQDDPNIPESTCPYCGAVYAKVEAELDYLEMEIKSFIQDCREDGMMTIADLRKLAYSIGIKDPDQIKQEIDLIREIQKVCRHRPCFKSDKRMLCEEKDCEWTAECRKLIAVWNR